MRPAYPRLLPDPKTSLASTSGKLTPQDFKKECDLGKGSFGKVCKVIHRHSGHPYAIKFISKEQLAQLKMEDQIRNEIEIMQVAQHPNIVRLVTYFEDDSFIYLVMELAENQLYAVLKQVGRFTEQESAKYMFDAANAVAYLHSRNPPIIHRDIKPENLLLLAGSLKMADFGWSNFKLDSTYRTTFCGTPDYLAPEMILGYGHTEKLDVWALGVLTYELLTGEAPFTPKINDKREKKAMMEKNILAGKFHFPKNFPPLAANLIKKALSINPQQRPSAAEIVQDEWFASFGLAPKRQAPQYSPLTNAFSGSGSNIASKENYDQSARANELNRDRNLSRGVSNGRQSPAPTNEPVLKSTFTSSTNVLPKAPVLQTSTSSSRYQSSQMDSSINSHSNKYTSSTNYQSATDSVPVPMQPYYSAAQSPVAIQSPVIQTNSNQPVGSGNFRYPSTNYQSELGSPSLKETGSQPTGQLTLRSVSRSKTQEEDSHVGFNSLNSSQRIKAVYSSAGSGLGSPALPPNPTSEYSLKKAFSQNSGPSNGADIITPGLTSFKAGSSSYSALPHPTNSVPTLGASYQSPLLPQTQISQTHLNGPNLSNPSGHLQPDPVEDPSDPSKQDLLKNLDVYKSALKELKRENSKLKSALELSQNKINSLEKVREEKLHLEREVEDSRISAKELSAIKKEVYEMAKFLKDNFSQQWTPQCQSDLALVADVKNQTKHALMSQLEQIKMLKSNKEGDCDELEGEKKTIVRPGNKSLVMQNLLLLVLQRVDNLKDQFYGMQTRKTADQYQPTNSPQQLYSALGEFFNDVKFLRGREEFREAMGTSKFN